MDVWNNLAVAFTLGPLTVRWYGILICAGMLLGIWLALREAERQHLDGDHLVNIFLWLIPAVIVGARAYYVLFNLDWYSQHPELIVAVWRGGLAIHGGIIAGVLVVLIYCRAKQQSFWRWVDVIVPSLALGQAIGRWGNFINQEAYGAVIEPGSFWSWMPLQVLANGQYHHPTFLYESVWDLLVFCALMWLLRKPHRVGSIFADYLIFYSIGRFFIEMLRMDSLMLGPFRVAMLVSGAGVLLGALILWRLESQPVVDVAALPEKRPGKKAPTQKKKK